MSEGQLTFLFSAATKRYPSSNSTATQRSSLLSFLYITLSIVLFRILMHSDL